MLAKISGRGLSLISAKMWEKAKARPAACSVSEWAAALTGTPHSYWRHEAGKRDELQFGSQTKKILKGTLKEIWSGFIHDGRKHRGSIAGCERICMLRETESYTDWFPPKGVLNRAHLGDGTGGKKNCNSRDVTECRAARKRALSCLLDVCPAGHAHR